MSSFIEDAAEYGYDSLLPPVEVPERSSKGIIVIDKEKPVCKSMLQILKVTAS